MHINGTMVASEFSLAIALTVFIIITVILAALLISLAASKNFRAVFFREKQQKKKSAKKPASSEPAQVQPQEVGTVVEQPKPRKAATRKSAESTPDYLDAIPTVPLGGVPIDSPTPAPAPRGNRARSGSPVRTVEIPSANEQGGTYTTRSITITRARSAKPTDGKSDKAENAQAERTPKKR